MRKYLFILTFLFLTPLLGYAKKPNPQKVENIIFVIGDGMGLPQITALYMESGMAPLQIERAQFIGIQKTYSANNRITDSAAAGTALACGEKTNNATIAIATDGRNLESVLTTAQNKGMATGIVVTYSPTDATPAAFMAHSINRKSNEDIAAAYTDSGIDFIAGSCPEFFNKRADGRDIISEMKDKGYLFAADKAEMLSADRTPVLALFPYEHIPFAGKDTLALRGDYLTEAAVKALDLMGNSDKKGLFLMVESSFIDWAGHNNDKDDVIAEMRDFDRLVGTMFDYADSHPGTLVIVTGDHETGGLTIVSKTDDYTAADSGINYLFSTEGHSGTFIPLFAYGTGAENFTGVMQNTDIAIRIKKIIHGKQIL